MTTQLALEDGHSTAGEVSRLDTRPGTEGVASNADHARIVQAIALRFACYGEGTPASSRNPVALTLAQQPAQFAFGVHVADVVAAVLELAAEQDQASRPSPGRRAG